MELRAASSGTAGIANGGFWGVPVEAGARYALSLFVRAPHGPPGNATVALLGGGAAAGGPPAVLAAALLTGLTPEWQRYQATLSASAGDANASLAVLFDGPGALVVDSVSLVPAANAERGAADGLLNPWPFRADLVGALHALQPRHGRGAGADGEGSVGAQQAPVWAFLARLHTARPLQSLTAPSPCP